MRDTFKIIAVTIGCCSLSILFNNCSSASSPVAINQVPKTSTHMPLNLAGGPVAAQHQHTSPPVIR